MQRVIRQSACFLPGLLLTGFAVTAEPHSESPAEKRELWTTSRVVGSPGPPPPYMVEEVYTDILWSSPIFAIREPGADWMLVVENSARGPAPESQPEQHDRKDKESSIDERGNAESASQVNGLAENETKNRKQNDSSGGGNVATTQDKVESVPARIVRVTDDPLATETEVLLEMYERVLYCVAFHPDYQNNGHLYLASQVPGAKGLNLVRVSRFTVPRDPAQAVDASQEEIIIEWESEGHDGGAIVFGQDGMLYIATGDGTADSDDWLAAQDVTRLQGSVLRIDVDHPAEGRAYSIPPDNPFLNLEGARGEIWAIGLRNPWRMTMDQRTGRIWIGVGGQDLWEWVNLLHRGENYGWSIYEGSHAFYLNRQRGPGEIVPPAIEHSHAEFISLTGGVAYYGNELPELNGVYVYGDYMTGAIWGARFDEDQLVKKRELARSPLNIVDFATTPSGQLLILDYAGSIHRLIKTPPRSQPQEFPQRLSETGIYKSVRDHQLHRGLIPYEVNAPAWTDGAEVERYLGLPGETQITDSGGVHWEFPDGTVLVQTLSLPDPGTATGAMRRVETRLLTRQQQLWAGYAYRWNDQQTDAALVGAGGDRVRLDSAHRPADDPSGAPTWRIPSRVDCMSCHSRVAGFALGLSETQLDRDIDCADGTRNQLEWFRELGILASDANVETDENIPRLVNPYDESEPLAARVRSYLHVNCSVCHQQSGGGNARIDLRIATKPEAMQLISVYPQHATFSIPQPLLIAPGEPERSVLYRRLSRRGPGQMPPRGTHVVDRRGVELLRTWIDQMSSPKRFVKDWQIKDLTSSLARVEQRRSHTSGAALFENLGCVHCHRFDGRGGGAGPILDELVNRQTVSEILESIIEPSRKIAPEFAESIVVTNDGKVLRGRIEQATDTTIVLRTADAFAPPIRVSKASIEERRLSDRSSMPEDILNVLELDEILDLLAYLVSGATTDHPALRSQDPQEEVLERTQ